MNFTITYFPLFTCYTNIIMAIYFPKVINNIIYEEDENGHIVKGSFRNIKVKVKRYPKTATIGNEVFKEILESFHPNIQRMFSYESDPTHHYIALELCTLNLKDYLEKSKRKKPKVIPMLEGATKGLFYLHSKNIVHKCLAPSKIYVDPANASAKLSIIWIEGDKFFQVRCYNFT